MASMELQQKRLAYRQALEENLTEILERLREMPEVEKVILFGSYAAGRCDLFTDLDLIVVIDTDQDFLHRTAGLYQKLPVRVDLDLMAYTPQEFEKMRESGFVRQALETGRVIYEKKPPG
jgi:predicted nucleotidyltransferase